MEQAVELSDNSVSVSAYSGTGSSVSESQAESSSLNLSKSSSQIIEEEEKMPNKQNSSHRIEKGIKFLASGQRENQKKLEKIIRQNMEALDLPTQERFDMERRMKIAADLG